VVAVDGGAVIGFAAYGGFRDTTLWPGYRFTVESSVHVVEGHHGRGVGRALMTALVEHAAAAGLHVMVAAVDGENAGSVEFHRAIGFVEVGRMPEIGRKFGRWLDLVLLQRVLSPSDPPDA
jgi:phosphinothricin acetyltransferase